jgi:hypothetical protein
MTLVTLRQFAEPRNLKVTTIQGKLLLRDVRPSGQVLVAKKYAYLYEERLLILLMKNHKPRPRKVSR